jgi:hypothetical protein
MAQDDEKSFWIDKYKNLEAELLALRSKYENEAREKDEQIAKLQSKAEPQIQTSETLNNGSIPGPSCSQQSIPTTSANASSDKDPSSVIAVQTNKTTNETLQNGHKEVDHEPSKQTKASPASTNGQPKKWNRKANLPKPSNTRTGDEVIPSTSAGETLTGGSEEALSNGQDTAKKRSVRKARLRASAATREQNGDSVSDDTDSSESYTPKKNSKKKRRVVVDSSDDEVEVDDMESEIEVDEDGSTTESESGTVKASAKKKKRTPKRSGVKSNKTDEKDFCNVCERHFKDLETHKLIHNDGPIEVCF